LEYQRINDTHKYNLEVQQKLEQLREYTTAEQRKLDEQRVQLQEDKRKFTDELTNRFKNMQEEHARLKDQLEREAQERIVAMEAEAEALRLLESAREAEKEARKEEQRIAMEVAERERQDHFEREKRDLEDRLVLQNEALKQHYDAQLAEKEAEVRALHHEIDTLRTQLAQTHVAARSAMLEPLSALMSSVFEAVRAASTHVPQGQTEDEKTNDFLHTLITSTAKSLNKYGQQYAVAEEGRDPARTEPNSSA